MKVINEEKLRKLGQELKEINKETIEGKEKVKEILKEMRECVEYTKIERDPVIDIIVKIREKYSKYTKSITVESDFLNGKCCYMSYMLKEIYGDEADIYMCCREEFHSVTKIRGKFYDVRGIIDEEALKNYRKCNNDDVLFFIDLCNVGVKVEKVRKQEEMFDRIVSEIKEEIAENNLKI